MNFLKDKGAKALYDNKVQNNKMKKGPKLFLHFKQIPLNKTKSSNLFISEEMSFRPFLFVDLDLFVV